MERNSEPKELFRAEARNGVFLLTALSNTEMDVYGSPYFRDTLVAATSDPAIAHIIIDFAELRFMDAAGVGVCVGVANRARCQEKTLKIDITRNEKIAKVFRLTDTGRLFDFICNARDDTTLETA